MTLSPKNYIYSIASPEALSFEKTSIVIQYIKIFYLILVFSFLNLLYVYLFDYSEIKETLFFFALSILPLIIIFLICSYPPKILIQESAKIKEDGLKLIGVSTDLKLFKRIFLDEYYFALPLSEKLLRKIYKNPKKYEEIFKENIFDTDLLSYRLHELER